MDIDYDEFNSDLISLILTDLPFYTVLIKFKSTLNINVVSSIIIIVLIGSFLLILTYFWHLLDLNLIFSFVRLLINVRFLLKPFIVAILLHFVCEFISV